GWQRASRWTVPTTDHDQRAHGEDAPHGQGAPSHGELISRIGGHGATAISRVEAAGRAFAHPTALQRDREAEHHTSFLHVSTMTSEAAFTASISGAAAIAFQRLSRQSDVMTRVGRAFLFDEGDLRWRQPM
ncbi:MULTISPECIES: hypothetical protein, partial [unclassified Bradyrhizobium]|uniref:hypothetical protein n=1 Tax=unclassified Bradyrhizobium TaxID=2631580 RepID=UPI0024E06441